LSHAVLVGDHNVINTAVDQDIEQPVACLDSDLMVPVGHDQPAGAGRHQVVVAAMYVGEQERQHPQLQRLVAQILDRQPERHRHIMTGGAENGQHGRASGGKGYSPWTSALREVAQAARQ
jgi:hypothetical protein